MAGIGPPMPGEAFKGGLGFAGAPASWALPAGRSARAASLLRFSAASLAFRSSSSAFSLLRHSKRIPGGRRIGCGNQKTFLTNDSFRIFKPTDSCALIKAMIFAEACLASEPESSSKSLAFG